MTYELRPAVLVPVPGPLSTHRTKGWSPREDVARWALFLGAGVFALGFLFLALGGGLGS